MNVLLFRIDRIVHAHLSSLERLRRGRRDRAICGQVFDETAQRLAPNAIGRNPPITCETDLRGLLAFTDLLERE